MWRVIAALLIVWLAVTILGEVIKGVFWLVVIGGALFTGAAIYGWVRQRINK